MCETVWIRFCEEEREVTSSTRCVFCSRGLWYDRQPCVTRSEEGSSIAVVLTRRGTDRIRAGRAGGAERRPARLHGPGGPIPCPTCAVVLVVVLVVGPVGLL